jgi:hypothetical protein
VLNIGAKVLKVCWPVHVLVPESDTLLEVIHVPPTLVVKHGATTAPAKVEVPVPVTESDVMDVVAKVAVPDTFNVPVAVRFVDVALPVMKVSPETVRAWDGVVVPMPTLPLCKILIASIKEVFPLADEEETEKAKSLK